MSLNEDLGTAAHSRSSLVLWHPLLDKLFHNSFVLFLTLWLPLYFLSHCFMPDFHIRLLYKKWVESVLFLAISRSCTVFVINYFWMYLTFPKGHIVFSFSSVTLTWVLALNYTILNYLIIVNIFQKHDTEKEKWLSLFWLPSSAPFLLSGSSPAQESASYFSRGKCQLFAY